MSEEKVKIVSRTRAATSVVNAIAVGRDAIVTQGLLVDEVEDIVVRSGGEPNLEASEKTLNKTLKSAEELGLIVLHRQTAVERIK